MRSIYVKVSNAAYRHKGLTMGISVLAAVAAARVIPHTYFWE